MLSCFFLTASLHAAIIDCSLQAVPEHASKYSKQIPAMGIGMMQKLNCGAEVLCLVKEN